MVIDGGYVAKFLADKTSVGDINMINQMNQQAIEKQKYKITVKYISSKILNSFPSQDCQKIKYKTNQ